MLLIVGALVVLAAIVAGYLMEGGALLALYQPAELVIIGGAALGSMLISTPLPLLKRLAGSFGPFFKDGPGKQDYLEMLGMMYQTFRLTQQSGVMALEAHCDDPQSSAIFSRFPKFLANHHAVDFFTDSVRVIIMGGVSPYDLESLMDLDLEVHHHEALEAGAGAGEGRRRAARPGHRRRRARRRHHHGRHRRAGRGDRPQGRRGAGRHLPRHPLCYGFVGPMATSLEHRVDFEGQYLATASSAGLLALSKGLAPAIAVEFARRVDSRGACARRSTETEQYCRAPQRRRAGRGGMSSGGQPIIVKRKKAGAPRPSWRRLEGRLRRLRDGDDGVLPRDVAGRPEQAVKSAVAGYFRDPGIFDQAKSDGPIAGGDLRARRRRRRRPTRRPAATGWPRASAPRSRRPPRGLDSGSPSRRTCVRSASRSRFR